MAYPIIERVNGSHRITIMIVMKVFFGFKCGAKEGIGSIGRGRMSTPIGRKRGLEWACCH